MEQKSAKNQSPHLNKIYPQYDVKKNIYIIKEAELKEIASVSQPPHWVDTSTHENNIALSDVWEAEKVEKWQKRCQISLNFFYKIDFFVRKLSTFV